MKFIAVYVIIQLLLRRAISYGNEVYPSSCTEITSNQRQRSSSLCSPDYILMAESLEYVHGESISGKLEIMR